MFTVVLSNQAIEFSISHVPGDDCSHQNPTDLQNQDRVAISLVFENILRKLLTSHVGRLEHH